MSYRIHALSADVEDSQVFAELTQIMEDPEAAAASVAPAEGAAQQVVCLSVCLSCRCNLH